MFEKNSCSKQELIPEGIYELALPGWSAVEETEFWDRYVAGDMVDDQDRRAEEDVAAVVVVVEGEAKVCHWVVADY